MTETIQVQLKKGVLELCVLALLSRGDGYAYDIASRLSQAIDMGEGTIYPLMRRMQADRLVETYLVESPAGPPRKYYRLTDAGRASFERQKAAWAKFSGAVATSLPPCLRRMVRSSLTKVKPRSSMSNARSDLPEPDGPAMSTARPSMATHDAWRFSELSRGPLMPGLLPSE